jgi:hypothetical protein
MDMMFNSYSSLLRYDWSDEQLKNLSVDINVVVAYYSVIGGLRYERQLAKMAMYVSSAGLKLWHRTKVTHM